MPRAPRAPILQRHGGVIMELLEARQIVGNQSAHSLRMMVKALELPVSKFLNTPEDWKRLEAAKLILKNGRK